MSLVHYTDKILRQKTSRFDFTNPPTDPIQLARTLAEEMIKHKALGIAAPQLGLPYRVFCIASNPIICMFNPVIADQSSEEVLLEEGCISFPNLIVKKKRPKIIKVRYAQPNSEYMTQKFVGVTARTILHELDHLNGILFFDDCTKLQLEMAMKKAKKRGNNYMFKDLLYYEEKVE